MRVIDSFTGSYSFLSNFEPCSLVYDGVTYPSSEHLFVAFKTLDPELRRRVSVVSTPGQAKRYGRTFDLRPDWELVKVYTMYFVLSLKFAIGGDLTSQLLDTCGSLLVEGNSWHDQT